MTRIKISKQNWQNIKIQLAQPYEKPYRFILVHKEALTSNKFSKRFIYMQKQYNEETKVHFGKICTRWN